MENAAALYRLLGDDARLRLLRALSRDRLNVTELTSILGLAQSGVSRHLGLLKDAGLVREDREAGFAYYRLNLDGGSQRTAALQGLLTMQFAEMATSAAVRQDEARLQEVLRLRKENFQAHGDRSAQLVPGRSWAAWSRALGLLLPALTVADLGCGEGYLAIEVSRWAKRVIAVDRSRDVLARARKLARRRRATNIVWKRGEIEHVPLSDGSVDLALLAQALHHAVSPAAALAEAGRIAAPGGHVLVLDLASHREDWVKGRLGDRWLGFMEADLRQLLCDAGLHRVQVRVGARRTGDPFTVLIATGVKAGHEAVRSKRTDPPLTDGKRKSRARRISPIDVPDED
jgi:ArsR family transcriptional regulator